MRTVADFTLPLTDALDGWAHSLILLGIGLIAGWFAKRIVFKRLQKIAKMTTSVWDDRVLAATKGLWAPAILFVALIPAAHAAPISPANAVLASRLAASALLAVVVLFASRLASAALAPDDGEQGAERRPALVVQAVRGVILVAGAIFVADNLGFEISTLLTALGVGSLALGLALQPTLSNLFAGIHISASKPIRVGDFIELEDGTQGHVVDIGWRATRLQQVANNLVEVPNSKLADMRLINYSLPETPQSVIVGVGVAYESDLDLVERVAIEVARSVQASLPEADPAHEPAVRFHTFGDSSIDFNVILRARAFTDRWPIVHEFVKRLKSRFDAEGIEIPFPQRVVHSARDVS